MFTVWHSTESLASWLIGNTVLAEEHKRGNVKLRRLYESDANNPARFHKVSTHLKRILYLDAPDVIVELDAEPIFSLEISSEAGTGHNAFQRFARIAASVENEVPAFYVYPEATFVYRGSDPTGRWDRVNPLIFNALEKAMRIYSIPALLFYFPSHTREKSAEFSRASKGLIYDERFSSCPDTKDGEMRSLFETANLTIRNFARRRGHAGLLAAEPIQKRRDWMLKESFEKKRGREAWSPLTSTKLIETSVLLKRLKKYAGRSHDFGDMLPRREKTLVYKVNAGFRGDPYPGALAALDYLECRSGKTFEERNHNLAMAWGDFSVDRGGKIVLEGDDARSVDRFVDSVKGTYNRPGRILLNRRFEDLKGEDIPRYFMQVRFGTAFTKEKHIRVYSYFCDAILFPDGALWREG